MTALGTFLLVVAKSKALVVCWVGQGSYLVKKKKKDLQKIFLVFYHLLNLFSALAGTVHLLTACGTPRLCCEASDVPLSRKNNFL